MEYGAHADILLNIATEPNKETSCKTEENICKRQKVRRCITLMLILLKNPQLIDTVGTEITKQMINESIKTFLRGAYPKCIAGQLETMQSLSLESTGDVVADN